MTNSLAKGMLAPLLDTQPLAQFRPMLRTGKPDEQGVLVPIKRIAVSPLAGDFALPAPIANFIETPRRDTRAFLPL